MIFKYYLSNELVFMYFITNYNSVAPKDLQQSGCDRDMIMVIFRLFNEIFGVKKLNINAQFLFQI